MTEYTEKDFRACRFNALEKNLLKNHEDLRRVLPLLPEDNDLIESRLRYVIAVYDPGSPLTREYPDLPNRKERARGLTNYVETIGGEEEKAAEIDKLIETISGYLRLYINNGIWAMLKAYEETFWEYQARLMMPIARANKGDKDELQAVIIKTKLSEDIAMLNDKIELYTKRFYQGDEEVQEIVKKKRVTPETIAE